MVELADASVFTAIDTTFARLKGASPTLRTEKISARIARLNALRKWIHTNRSAIHEAMFKDFSKPALEVDVIEVFHVLSEIKLAVNSLADWSKPKKVDAPVTMLGTRSFIQYEPRGRSNGVSHSPAPAGGTRPELAAGLMALSKRSAQA